LNKCESHIILTCKLSQNVGCFEIKEMIHHTMIKRFVMLETFEAFSILSKRIMDYFLISDAKL